MISVVLISVVVISVVLISVVLISVVLISVLTVPILTRRGEVKHVVRLRSVAIPRPHVPIRVLESDCVFLAIAEGRRQHLVPQLCAVSA